MGSARGPVPDTIHQLEEQLQQFRSAHPRRSKLPEALWQAAVEEARQHGIYLVAHTLRLDYGSLKKRLSGVSPQERRPAVLMPRTRGRKAPPSRRIAPPAFVELVSGAGVDAGAYVIEFESGAGPRMRVRWRGTTPEWSSLLRAWRDVAG